MTKTNPIPLGEKVARQREERADALERAIGHHRGSVWAVNARADVTALRAAAARARGGDLSPFALA